MMEKVKKGIYPLVLISSVTYFLVRELVFILTGK